MGYETVVGRTVEFPFALAAELARGGNEAVLELVTAARRVYDTVQVLDMRVRYLEAEVRGLKRENEFLLRELNEVDDG